MLSSKKSSEQLDMHCKASFFDLIWLSAKKNISNILLHALHAYTSYESYVLQICLQLSVCPYICHSQCTGRLATIAPAIPFAKNPSHKSIHTWSLQKQQQHLDVRYPKQTWTNKNKKKTVPSSKQNRSNISYSNQKLQKNKKTPEFKNSRLTASTAVLHAARFCMACVKSTCLPSGCQTGFPKENALENIA